MLFFLRNPTAQISTSRDCKTIPSVFFSRNFLYYSHYFHAINLCADEFLAVCTPLSRIVLGQNRMTSFGWNYPGNKFNSPNRFKISLALARCLFQFAKFMQFKEIPIANQFKQIESHQFLSFWSLFLILMRTECVCFSYGTSNVFEFWPMVFWLVSCSNAIIVRKWDDYCWSFLLLLLLLPVDGIEYIDYSKQIIWQFFIFTNNTAKSKIDCKQFFNWKIDASIVCLTQVGHSYATILRHYNTANRNTNFYRLTKNCNLCQLPFEEIEQIFIVQTSNSGLWCQLVDCTKYLLNFVWKTWFSIHNPYKTESCGLLFQLLVKLKPWEYIFSLFLSQMITHHVFS